MYVAYKFWLLFILRTCSRVFGKAESGKVGKGEGKTGPGVKEESSDKEGAKTKQVKSVLSQTPNLRNNTFIKDVGLPEQMKV